MIVQPYHQQLSNKLGWGDMLAEVAMPAIDAIITNHGSHINDYTGDVIDAEDLAESLLLDSWSPDDIFSLLVSPYYAVWEQEKEIFTSLRWEIEEYMRRGMSYLEAIGEWYK